MTYEELQIANEDLNIQELDLSEVSDLKGLYMNRNIAIHTALSRIEKACVLAEELGHHYTSSGNILDLKDVRNRKQECKARLWAYNKQIGLLGLIRAHEHGCHGRFELAEFLDVSEEFLQAAIECYTSKYGEYTILDSYVIYFIPNLGVAQLFAD